MTAYRAIDGGRGQWLGGTMASAEHEPITGVWEQSPQWGPGAEPLVRGRSPPEAESIFVIGCPTEPANFLVPRTFSLVPTQFLMELGAQPSKLNNSNCHF